MNTKIIPPGSHPPGGNPPGSNPPGGNPPGGNPPGSIPPESNLPESDPPCLRDSKSKSDHVSLAFLFLESECFVGFFFGGGGLRCVDGVSPFGRVLEETV